MSSLNAAALNKYEEQLKNKQNNAILRIAKCFNLLCSVQKYIFVDVDNSS
jgi:hypothetical protein